MSTNNGAGEEVISHGGKRETYSEFVGKFKPKHTTDDCMTPPEIYDIISDYVVRTYDKDPETFVRPFWPGGDYEAFEYPDGCVVVDNPPFSQLAKIYKFYQKRGIDFFIFAPTLMLFNSYSSDFAALVCACTIEYENGAKVATSFVTSLESETRARTAPDLSAAIQAKVDEMRAKKTRKFPRYEYPINVAYPAGMSYLAKNGISYGFEKKDSHWVSALDEQKKQKKRFFGSGYLLSDKAAQAQAQAQAQAPKQVWQLSDRERDIIANLGKPKDKNDDE